MRVNGGKQVIYFPPFVTSDFFCDIFCTPAGRSVKFPLEAHINPPMWIYVHIIAVKFMFFYGN